MRVFVVVKHQGCGTGFVDLVVDLLLYIVQSTWPPICSAELLGVDISTFTLAISQAKLDKTSDIVQSKVRCLYDSMDVTAFLVLGGVGRGGGG